MWKNKLQFYIQLCYHSNARVKWRYSFYLFIFVFWFFRASPTAYGSSQARGGIGAASVTYTTAHGNARSLTHWARPGIKPASSWILVRFFNYWATTGILKMLFLKIQFRSSCRGAVVNESRNHEVAGLIPALAPWVKDLALQWAVV